jgi:hypothetical protein
MAREDGAVHDGPSMCPEARAAPDPVAAAVMRRLHGPDVWEGFAPRPGASADGPVEGWNGDHPSLTRLAASGGVVIDVGVWKGQSTIAMATAMRDAGREGCVIAVDTFLGSVEHWGLDAAALPRTHGLPDLYRAFLDNVFLKGVASRVVPLPQTSLTAAAILRRAGISARLVHIDAGHDKADVLGDAEAYWALLEPGGMLVGDDYAADWPGVIRGAHAFSVRVGVPLEVEYPKWIMRKP